MSEHGGWEPEDWSDHWADHGGEPSHEPLGDDLAVPSADHDWHEPPPYVHDIAAEHDLPAGDAHPAETPADDMAADDALPEHAPSDHDDSFPPHLEVSIMPTDGRDWVDPGLLGVDSGVDLAHEPGSAPYAAPEELLGALHAADGSGGEPSWESLRASDDPAIRALAVLWHPAR